MADDAGEANRDLYEPWRKLVRIVLMGKVLEVPENNLLLRQLAYLSPDVAMGRYCWNGECRYCEVSYARDGDAETAALACRVKGFEGMRVTKAALEIRYNMAEVLASAPKATDDKR
ncbi:MAG TPA: hypothetical protein VFM29_04640 [Vicinamibacteria bacterium]|nr:hypothetical protein [Vicinamibacteria bacterium]